MLQMFRLFLKYQQHLVLPEVLVDLPHLALPEVLVGLMLQMFH
jgi:hypothetical protein